ncbi:hypothetical protein VSR17_21465 [Cupriavidus taiwanensis]|uniref:hypothetical protein n=1 Tax=Cupriavidus taiwanensis TaxID=164546 RepID=UPI000E17C14C|nr:hypothetical protein [Cupriavidus taiwanensis]SPA38254.1 hypothetical protein CBM2623_U10029 [Cupriavidus taiwanensis]
MQKKGSHGRVGDVGHQARRARIEASQLVEEVGHPGLMRWLHQFFETLQFPLSADPSKLASNRHPTLPACKERRNTRTSPGEIK